MQIQFTSCCYEERNEVLTALKPGIGFNIQHLKLGLCVSMWVDCLGLQWNSEVIESVFSCM